MTPQSLPRRIVVIGATGALGKELIRLLGHRAIGLSHTAADVTDREGVTRIIDQLRPDWVINTSAFHRLEECELDAGLAFGVNAAGAGYVARAAARAGAGVMSISTDHVFSGVDRPARAPYTESDVPDPLSVYAISKRAGEQLIAQGNPRHIIVRTAGLYGWQVSRKGWAFPDLMIRKALAGEALSVVSDQVTSPTFALHVAQAAIALIDRDASGVFHVANGGECSWYELARRTLDLVGLDVAITPTETVEGPDSAKRPRYSALASERLGSVGVAPLPSWHDALAEYVAGRHA